MLSLILEWQFIKWSHQEYRYWIFVGINIMFNESADVWLHTPIRSFYTRHAKIIIRIIYYPMDQKSKTHSLLFFSFPFWTRILTCICHCLSHRSRLASQCSLHNEWCINLAKKPEHYSCRRTAHIPPLPLYLLLDSFFLSFSLVVLG